MCFFKDKPLKVGDCFMCGVQMKKDKKESDPNRVITVTVDPETLGKLEVRNITLVLKVCLVSNHFCSVVHLLVSTHS